MTTSSAANWPAYALAIRVDVIERDVNPLGKVPDRLVIASERPQLPPLTERVDRLAREPQQRRRSPRRHEPSAVLLEQSRQLRIAGLTVWLRHCQTIVAQPQALRPALVRSRRAWG